MKITQEAFEKLRGNFSIKEFCITGECPPEEVAQSIIDNHINVLNPIREKLGVPVIVSQKSGYRPKDYELSKGRSGKSQHTFEDKEGNVTGGAVDLTSTKLGQLLDLLISDSNYTRICYYPINHFIHCDHNPTADGKRQYFNCMSPTGSWKFIKFI